MEIDRYLVESALLTHGLKSISNEELINRWKSNRKNIVWIDNGNIIFGGIGEFAEFRKNSDSLIRIDCYQLDDAIENKKSGALTASGTMKVCEKEGIKLAITCGMGGIGDIKGEELCPDLPALRDINVALISTSPKDMLKINETIDWLKNKGVRVVSENTDRCSGYIFNSADVEIEKVDNLSYESLTNKLLILNGIPTEKRVNDLSILQIAIQSGKEAEKHGRYYHPAVNAKIDELSRGYSSEIQLDSIINNIELAEKICYK